MKKSVQKLALTLFALGFSVSGHAQLFGSQLTSSAPTPDGSGLVSNDNNSTLNAPLSESVPQATPWSAQTASGDLNVFGFVLTKCQIPSAKNVPMGTTIQAKTVAKTPVNISVECTAQSTEWKLTGVPSIAFRIGTAALAGNNHYAMAFVDSGYTKPLAQDKWDVRGIGDQTVTLYVGVGQQTAGSPETNGLNVIADAGWFSTTIPLVLTF
jgi:hypothetical protein